MNIVLFDTPEIRVRLLPLTFVRPVGEMRVGILTIREKWERFLKTESISCLTEEYLSGKFPFNPLERAVYVHSAVLPNQELAIAIKNLKDGERLNDPAGNLVAFRGAGADMKHAKYPIGPMGSFEVRSFTQEVTLIDRPWKCFALNGPQLRQDFELITNGKQSHGIKDEFTATYAEGHIFAEEEVKVRSAILNAEDGPIYLGKRVEIQEGAIIHGPVAILEGTVISMGAKIRADTTIGPFCKVGGEVRNSVFLGYSNKAHDGFLGNAVIGEWCNLGADTNNSNLKNNYALVRLWDYETQRFVSTGLQFCGLIMGDHSKCGINTMFNTGTVVGFGANIYGAGFPRNFIPSFSWGGAAGFTEYNLDKFFEVAEVVMARRDREMDVHDRQIVSDIFAATKNNRRL